MKKDKWAEETYDNREIREEYGRIISQKSAEQEKLELADGATEIPTHDLDMEMSDEEIKKRVGSGNFKTAKDDRNQQSINS
ncbi:hypothetical protein [Planococcus lenghuensis]|uniref:Uncharacterized protein n=1 Tax=Planococcus lenghuensis TaxID=2213202 RepID=A0A1Q2KVP2_9BACL|nr:hypothetical protein [Planococcus lenghuensis]AQQ52288.1 hypothetical protein B0X71_03625 [Planococcus lenghuensis]